MPKPYVPQPPRDHRIGASFTREDYEFINENAHAAGYPSAGAWVYAAMQDAIAKFKKAAEAA